MKYLEFDGERLHRSKVTCDGSMCSSCFEYGKFYAGKMSATLCKLDIPHQLFNDRGIFYVRIADDANLPKILDEFSMSTSAGIYITRHIKCSSSLPSSAILVESLRNHNIITGTPNFSRILRRAVEVTQNAGSENALRILGIKEDLYEILMKAYQETYKEFIHVPEKPKLGLYCSSCLNGISLDGKDPDVIQHLWED